MLFQIVLTKLRT